MKWSKGFCYEIFDKVSFSWQLNEIGYNSKDETESDDYVKFTINVLESIERTVETGSPKRRTQSHFEDVMLPLGNLFNSTLRVIRRTLTWLFSTLMLQKNAPPDNPLHLKY